MATIVFVDSSAHPSAVAYYSPGRREPTMGSWWITATRVVAQDHLTLETILSELAASASPGDSIIIVSHGQDTGLSLPIVSGRDARARVDILNVLRNDRPRRYEGFTLPASSDAEAARQIGNGFDAPTVARIRDLMRRVQAKRLNHVALRACMVGSYPDAMTTFREFFGARSLSAPRHIRDTFAALGPEVTADPARVRAWRRRHRTPQPPFPYSTPHGQVELWTGAPRSDHSYPVRMRADTLEAVREWARQWLSGGAPYASGTLYYHGFYRMAPAPNEPTVVFPGDPAFYDFLASSGTAMTAQQAAQPAPSQRAVARVATVLATQRAAGNRAAARVAVEELVVPDALLGRDPPPAPKVAPPAARDGARSLLRGRSR